MNNFSEEFTNHPTSVRERPLPAILKAWLIVGLCMIFAQVVIGGITRLTGSGLSITRWEIVTGTLPPLNQAQWEAAFELYRATPQYEMINRGMSMREFQFIYFWEYLHRLWARLMGFVFIIPFAIFYWRGLMPGWLLRRLGVVFLLATLAASFGWIMVASGLVDRPWVNAYKLSIHLSIAFTLFGYLLWTTLLAVQPNPKVFHNKMLKRWARALLFVLAIQIVLGGIMSGMKAALVYPTWPDMKGEFIPSPLFDAAQWNLENFVRYERSPFMAALVQVLHRSTAYLLIAMGLYFFSRGLRARESKPFQVGLYLFLGLLIAQALVGIFTLLRSVGVIPVGLGVLHQASALLLLGVVLFLMYQMRRSPAPAPVEKYVEN
jgi:cytochrome c oxidase assembly protein subunit 15